MIRLRLTHAALVLCSTLTACIDSDVVGVKQTGTSPQYAVPANWNGNVRVGVVPSATTVTIGTTGDYTVRAGAGGSVLMSGTNGNVAVTLASPGVSRFVVQVICGGAAAAQVQIDRAISYGLPYLTEPCPFGTRVLIVSGLLPTASFTIRTQYINYIKSLGFPQDAFSGGGRTFSTPTYQITRPGSPGVSSTLPPVLTSSTGFVTIDGATYRGAAEVIANSLGTVAGVNELPMEQYLYGVVPRELGPTVFPEFEAQKAQAVAARTYAMKGLGKRALDGYDLLATVSDQVYGGFAAEHPVSSAAVDATHGETLTHNGLLIDAMFSSATGGHSANSEEVFANAIPYLRGVPDAERGQALEHVPSLDVFKMHRNPRSLRGAREGDFESNWSSRHSWTFEWSADEISDVLSAWKGFDVGVVSAINVLDRGPSGRILTIEYVTEAGTFTSSKDGIRSSLRFIGAGNALSNLYSTLFFVEAVEDKNTGRTGFAVYGAGFGHGVGLGQTGAVGMAQKGHTYDEILKHYYTDVELSSAY